jgi:hypothetical protein
VSTENGPAPELTDGIVTLRAHTALDADAIVSQSLDTDSQRWTTVPRDYTRDQALSFIGQTRSAWQEPGRKRSSAIEWVDASGRPRFAGTI